MASLRELEQYQYGSGDSGGSWWDDITTWFWARMHELFGSSAGEHTLLFLELSIVALVIAATIYLVLKNKARAAFYGKNASVQVRMTDDDSIHGIDFDLLINDAVAAKDYRLAIRLNFLRLLKILNDAGKIRWETGKTNHDYLRELQTDPRITAFAETVRIYEYIWYGDFQPAEDTYSASVNTFREVEHAAR